MITAPQSITKQGNYKSEIKIHKEQLENRIKNQGTDSRTKSKPRLRRKNTKNPLYKDMEFSAHFFSQTTARKRK